MSPIFVAQDRGVNLPSRWQWRTPRRFRRACLGSRRGVNLPSGWQWRTPHKFRRACLVTGFGLRRACWRAYSDRGSGSNARIKAWSIIALGLWATASSRSLELIYRHIVSDQAVKPQHLKFKLRRSRLRHVAWRWRPDHSQRIASMKHGAAATAPRAKQPSPMKSVVTIDCSHMGWQRRPIVRAPGHRASPRWRSNCRCARSQRLSMSKLVLSTGNSDRERRGRDAQQRPRDGLPSATGAPAKPLRAAGCPRPSRSTQLSSNTAFLVSL